MNPFPFCKLPSEIRNMIHFEAGLREFTELALTMALNKPEQECTIMHDFLVRKNKMDPRVLVVLQTIYYNGVTQGSADWARYAACKQDLYNNPDLKIDKSRLGITWKDLEDVIGEAEWAQFIVDACDHNFELWGVIAEDDQLYFRRGLQCFDEPSDTEIQRVVLAVHQFKAYTALLHASPSSTSFAEASLLAENFFRYLTPWEREQLISIPEILTYVYQMHIYALTDTYLDFSTWVDKTYVRLSNRAVMKSFLKFIQRKAGTDLQEYYTQTVCLRTITFKWMTYPPDQALSRLLDHGMETDEEIDIECMESYKRLLRGRVLWSALLQIWASSQAEENLIKFRRLDPKEDTLVTPDVYEQLLNFDHDRDRERGPRQSWMRWYMRFRIEDPAWFGSNQLSRLRSTGYIFWDESRMERHWYVRGRLADDLADPAADTSSEAPASSSPEPSAEAQPLNNAEDLTEAEVTGEGEDANDADFLPGEQTSSGED